MGAGWPPATHSTDDNARKAWLLTNLLYRKRGYLIGTRDGDLIDDLVVEVVTARSGLSGRCTWLRSRITTPDDFFSDP